MPEDVSGDLGVWLLSMSGVLAEPKANLLREYTSFRVNYDTELSAGSQRPYTSRRANSQTDNPFIHRVDQTDCSLKPLFSRTNRCVVRAITLSIQINVYGHPNITSVE
jgi:hypothetical protein